MGDPRAPSISRAGRPAGSAGAGRCREGGGRGARGPSWPEFGAPPLPPPVGKTRARGRGGCEPLKSEEQEKQPREEGAVPRGQGCRPGWVPSTTPSGADGPATSLPQPAPRVASGARARPTRGRRGLGTPRPRADGVGVGVPRGACSRLAPTPRRPALPRGGPHPAGLAPGSCGTGLAARALADPSLTSPRLELRAAVSPKSKQ